MIRFLHFNHFLLMLFLIGVGCHDFQWEPNYFDFKQIKKDIFTQNDVSISSLISESMSLNWTENQDCLNELIAIKNGLANFDEWAVKIVDAWGKFPSGIMNGNFFDLGSFPQCFHIKQNEMLYKTQYCIGQIIFKPKELIQRSFTMPRIYAEPSISLGLCLPSVCSVNHLESMVNQVIRARSINNVTITIPMSSCQFEEKALKFNTFDLTVIGLLGILLILNVLGTSYDVYCTDKNRSKFQAIKSFSVKQNAIKLFSTQHSDSDAIDCLHGIRVIQSLCLVSGHTGFMYVALPVTNGAALLTFRAKYYSMFWFSSMIAVDSFLVISGLLVSMNLLKYLKKNGKLNVFVLYVHRYFRLTPLLAVCVLLSMSLWRFMGNGPVWTIMVDYMSPSCDRYWWSVLAYIQNYVNPTEVCFIHSWYLSVDTQLFLIAPLIIYLLYRFNTKMVPVLLGLIFGCVGCTLAVHVKNNLRTLMEGDKLIKAYFPTHTRYSSWLIGIITGYLLFKFPKSSIRIPHKINLFGWTISLILMISAIFANYPLLNFECDPFWYGFYDALSRVGWSAGLSYIIFACVQCSGGRVNTFLSHPLWQPLSKLNYALYLVHYPIVMTVMATTKTPLYFSELGFFVAFIENYILSIAVAIVAMLTIQYPIVSIEKIFSKNQNQTTENCEIKSNEQFQKKCD